MHSELSSHIYVNREQLLIHILVPVCLLICQSLCVFIFSYRLVTRLGCPNCISSATTIQAAPNHMSVVREITLLPKHEVILPKHGCTFTWIPEVSFSTALALRCISLHEINLAWHSASNHMNRGRSTVAWKMTSPFAFLWRIDQIWPTLERLISPLRTVHNSSRQWSFLSRHSLYTQTNESLSRSLRAFCQVSLLSGVWEVCNFKCFLLNDCYVSVLRLSSCICRFTHSIQWYMNQIWQCKTGSYLSQMLGMEKCQLQKITAHWCWTSLYIAFEALLQHPQFYPTRYLSPWKPQACNLESFSAPYVISSDVFEPHYFLVSPLNGLCLIFLLQIWVLYRFYTYFGD